MVAPHTADDDRCGCPSHPYSGTELPHYGTVALHILHTVPVLLRLLVLEDSFA